MNKLLKTNLIILLIAIVPSVGFVRWNTMNNVPFCVQSAGCSFDIKPKGAVTERFYGFPATYRMTSVFKPVNNNQNDPNYAGYTSASSEQRGFSKLYILVNIVFWVAVLQFLAKWLPKRKPAAVAVEPSDSTADSTV